MKYSAKPVIVDAHIIVEVGPVLRNGSMHCALQNGELEVATKEMISRFIPSEGDYWVIQADGYVYLNPKDVFLRKYSPCPPERPAMPTFLRPTCRGSYVFNSACGNCERCTWERSLQPTYYEPTFAPGSNSAPHPSEPPQEKPK